MKTIVVNMYAGPGAGKSTLAAALFAFLKMRGYNVEMALEFAKDKVWENSLDVLKNQFYIFGKQHHRIFRLLDKVEVIITDSPLLISLLYDQTNNVHFREMVKFEYNRLTNLDVFINRNKDYNPEGRLQSPHESEQLDIQMKRILVECGVMPIYFTYDYGSINEVLTEITNHIEDLQANIE